MSVNKTERQFSSGTRKARALKLMIAGALFACAFGGIALRLDAADDQAATQTTRPVVGFFDPTLVYGESTLTRTDDGITMHLTAKGVPAGVYTGWIPIFEPGGTTPVVAGWVTSQIVGADGGTLTLTAHLNEGQIISGHPVFSSGSLTDARGQDIGMVVRHHGLPDPARIYEQTHTFEPGVAVDFLRTRHNAP